MCGIAGRVNHDRSRPVDEWILRGMTDGLAHRGPDSSGIWIEGAVGLGHRRLAIIDLSPAGHQPMTSGGAATWITFNGEIYNYLELREELEARGHRFRSRSDTEVILAAYEEFGVDCLQHLRGMFAFGLWDSHRRRLFLARDRTGKKPLFYWDNGESFSFASEAKAFLADPTFQPRADPCALFHYLSLQSVPSPLSAFRGVRKLPPAHYLVLENGHVSTARYWALSYEPKLAVTVEEADELLLARLRQSVRLRLISDVPLGAFLSGGIDSGVVVALMAEASGTPVKTFSIGFHEDAFNELPQARDVATRFGTEHHEFVVTPDAHAMLERLVWHYNEPFADPSALPTFYLSQLTRQHVTVALNGDGGDESFGGYERYRTGRLAEAFASVPQILRRGAMAIADTLPDPGQVNAPLARLRRWLEVNGHDADRRYAIVGMQFRPALKRKLMTEDFARAAACPATEDLLLAMLASTDASKPLDRMLAADVSHYLPDTLLTKVDIASMAYGLEARSPFLDHEVMELAARLPVDMKVRRGVTKYLLRRLAERLLPSAIVQRPKHGFSVPLDRWFRHDLKDFSADVLLSQRATERGYFDHRAVRELLEQHWSGARSWHDQIWNLVMLELWQRAFTDGESRSPGTR